MKKLAILLIFLLTGCSSYKTADLENNIVIDKININKEYNISSINGDVEGIVLFEEYGRPNVVNSNTIIGAHSGYGDNAYFNLINRLKENDVIILYYDNIRYDYLVEKVYSVKEKDIYVLEDKGYSALTLITCNIFNFNERTIVISRLII